MAIDVGEVKKGNILDLAKQLHSLTRELQDTLDKHFNRAPDSDCKGEETTPVMPNVLNVLDEIIDELSIVQSDLYRSLDFLSKDILPKIN